MPLSRTRSATAANLRQNTIPERPKRKRSRPTPIPGPAGPIPVADVIELSSDSENLHPAKKSPSKRKALPTSAREIFEISDSGEDKVGPSNPRSKVDPKTRITRLKADNDRLKKELYSQRKDLDSARIELKKTKRELSAQVSKASTSNLASLEEVSACEICTMPMWNPYLLADCGHVFCKLCLTNWFNTTQVQHMNSHPGYTPFPPYVVRSLRNPFGLDVQAFVRAHDFVTHNAPPNYTCPTCRKSVTKKPVEDFALKKVIDWVARAQNSHIPTPEKGGGGVDPWDGFLLI